MYCLGASIESSGNVSEKRRNAGPVQSGPTAGLSAADWRQAPDVCARVILGIGIPDSEMTYCASTILRNSGTPSLYNHCVRAFLLGMFDAGRRQLYVDEEVVFISAMLHGLALTETRHGDPKKSYEENSAEFARTFAIEGGFSAERVEKIANGILRHADQTPAADPDVALVMIGAAQDIYGPAPDELSGGLLRSVEAEVPRLDFKRTFVATLREHVARSKMPTWTEEFVQTPPIDFYENRWSE
jgi:hypothetical protein